MNGLDEILNNVQKNLKGLDFESIKNQSDELLKNQINEILKPITEKLDKIIKHLGIE